MDLWLIDIYSISFWFIAFGVLIVIACILKLWKDISLIKTIYIGVALVISSALFVAFHFLYSEVFAFPFIISSLDEFDANFALAFLGTITGVVALFGGFLAIQRTDESKRTNKIADDTNKITMRQNEIANRQANTAEQESITARIDRATEGLGKKDGKIPIIEARIGALISLEQIAQDNIRYHISVMEILCAYIQENSPRDATKDLIDTLELRRKDIQVALTIIGRRHKWAGGEKYMEREAQQNYRLDLRHCDLRKAELDGTNFSKARFNNSDLTQTDLHESNVSYANFNDAMLVGTNFWGADIKYAKFVKAKAQWAYFSRSDMSCTQLDDIELNNTRFNSTIMKGAYAENGGILENLTLSDHQIDQMYCGPFIKRTEEEEEEKKFVRPKHWPNGFTFDFEEKYKKWLEKTYPDLAKNFE